MAKPADEGVRATPLWFGPDDRPLFGWLHVPRGGVARGGVLLFPPLTIEAARAYFAYRVLATRLAENGLAALRFDYDGTGDSFGDENDPDRTEAWLASGTAALDLLRSTGVEAVGFVGMRMGGLFAAAEARRIGGVDALVLWDTCLSGRRFLREQQALRLVSLGGPAPDGAVDAPGLRFSKATVETLSELDLGRPEERLANKMLVLEPPGRTRPAQLSRRLAAHEVDWAEAVGQEALLDPLRQDTPWLTIAAVTDWLTRQITGDPRPVLPPPSRAAVISQGHDGGPVHERPVTFASGLFGILTEPAHPLDAPTVVLVNEANTPHIGPSRLWVDLARSWADSGLRVLRFDLSGNGDSDPHPGQAPHGVRDPEALDDVIAAAEMASPDDRRNIVLVGLCSGAYQAMEAALLLRPRSVCLVNPQVTFVPPEVEAGRPSTRQAFQSFHPWLAAAGQPPVRWLAARVAPHRAETWAQALRTGSWTAALAKRGAPLPEAVLGAVHRWLVTGSPTTTFERLVATGVQVLVVCGPDDASLVTAGQARALERLKASPLFRLELLDELDSAAQLIDERQRLREVLRDHVLALRPTEPYGAG